MKITIIKVCALTIMLALSLLAYRIDFTVFAQATDQLRIFGLVDKPLNLSLDQLHACPMVSEVAELKCIAGLPDVTYNWTGIPLFYLLTLAQIKPEANKIVTRARAYDGFESDLLVEDALRPTTILALEANGTTQVQGILGFPRLVVPLHWGYKWVAEVDEIEVVNSTDYKGTYESVGYSDSGERPDSGPLPTQIPPMQNAYLSFGNRTFDIQAFANASVGNVTFYSLEKSLNFTVAVEHGASGFVNMKVEQGLLKTPYNVTVDEKPTDAIEVDTSTASYVYLVLDEGFHNISISGLESLIHVPEINVSYEASIYVGQNATFDASNSVDIGSIVSYNWTFGDGSYRNGTEAVVSHSYDKQATYEVGLAVTNNEGISSFKAFTVTVTASPENIILPLKIVLGAVVALLILMFVYLLLTRRKSMPPMKKDINA
jgi:hypothetical protein